MAATDVLPSSPMTPGQVAPWSSFDDYLDFPSPLATPRLAAAVVPSSLQSSALVSAPSSQPAQQAAQTPSSGGSSSALPPPAGSSPEVLFRYYLAAELRRIGSSADEAIIDKYVAQHYDSFTRAMDRQQSQTGEQSRVPAAPVANNGALLTASTPQDTSMAAFRSSPPTGPSSAPYLLSNDSEARQSINPHLMELSSVHQPFTVSRLPTVGEKQVSPATVTPIKKGKFREASADDDMSEDEEEDDDNKDRLSDLVNEYKASPSGSTSSRGQNGLTAEETPIAGSIMGPANELRPDPEAYRKLSSKEKRQLRNKISARNFRTRRKEHIALLEQQVADRDTIIEGLRQQLAQVNVQNKDLTEEVRVLKTKSISHADVSRIIEALQKGATSSAPSTSANTNTDMGPPSHLLRSSSNSSLSETFNGGRPSTPSMLPSSPRSNSPHPLITRPNMRKDLPSSSNANSSKSFWGGELGGMGSNFMSVHTVLVPHLMNVPSLPARDSKRSIAPSSREEAVDLSLLLSEKLKVADEGGNVGLSKMTSESKNQEANVNEALVSLLGGDDVAPPSYSEAITAASSDAFASSPAASPALDLNDERLRTTVLGALNKAFCSQAAPSSVGKGALPLSDGGARLDASKIQALLEGRATLVLFDEEKGQVWSEHGENGRRSSYSADSSMTV